MEITLNINDEVILFWKVSPKKLRMPSFWKVSYICLMAKCTGRLFFKHLISACNYFLEENYCIWETRVMELWIPYNDIDYEYTESVGKNVLMMIVVPHQSHLY